VVITRGLEDVLISRTERGEGTSGMGRERKSERAEQFSNHGDDVLEERDESV